MGIYPLEFERGHDATRYRLTGEEIIDIAGLDGVSVGTNPVAVRVTRSNGNVETIPATLRIDSAQELAYLRHQGVLPYVVRKVVAATRAAA
jgi:aconitate hydratase